ncbi:MAG: hypothetical protein AAF298_19190 [Cyanobacteria bacterium P01_A01_bin.40]
MVTFCSTKYFKLANRQYYMLISLKTEFTRFGDRHDHEDILLN